MKDKIVIITGGTQGLGEGIARHLAELGAAGLQQDTLLIVTADHGEEFYEHGKVGHGHSLFQELLHVPLIVRFPGLPGPRRVSQLVSLVDIAPTIVDMFNLGPAAASMGRGVEGNSLLPYLLGQRTAGPDAAFSNHQGERMAVVAGPWKLVMYGPTQSALFSLQGDTIEDLPLLVDHFIRRLAARTGKPYQTRLDPPPADPRVAHPPRDTNGRRVS